VVIGPPVAEGVVPFADDLEPLLAGARGGDSRALERLLRTSYDRAYPVCRRLLGNDVDAADACQEALMSVVRNLPRFDGRSRYTTWLYRIAVNASIDELRRRSRRRVVPFMAGSARTGRATGQSGRSDAEPVAAGGGPDDGVGMLDLEAALMALPLDYRSAVVLRDVCGLDYAEIADALGIPGGTVRSRIARGRSLLAGRLRATEEGSR
jgi:RNA polymerase sigma-70 factor (ECF subfamily)